MKKVLLVEASPRGSDSASRTIAAELVEKLRKDYGGIELTIRDLNATPLPHIDSNALAAFFTPPEQRQEQHRYAATLSDKLVDELLAHDILIIASPMWNFSVPSVLKAWIDHVVRAGKTFSFAGGSLQGLAAGRQAYVISASGSVFSSGPFASYDFLSPYLQAVLGFIGISDTKVIRVEGLNDPNAKEKALAQARAAFA